MADSAPQWPALLSLAVHELRSPATVVSGYVKMLLRGHGGTLSATQRDALVQVEQSCERVAELLSGMGDFARLNAGRATLAADQVDVSILLSEAAGCVQPTPGLTFRLVAMPPQTACAVVVDRVRAAHAIAALAAMIARADELETVVATGELVGDRAVITVSPTAERITPATLDDLGPFNEFAGGLGLALPLARFVIESAGGRLHAMGTGGASGHRAAIVLPAAPPAAQD